MTQVVKPPMKGLAFMGGPQPTGYTNIKHVVVTVFASECWPTPTSVFDPQQVRVITYTNNEINLGHTDPSSPTVQTVMEAQRASGRGLVKIRILWGGYAPDWMKRVNGFTPMATDSGFTLGPYWRSDYQALYTQCLAQMAQRYDTDWLVADVAIGCTNAGTSGEPFVRPPGPILAASLFAAGVSAPAGGVGPSLEQIGCQAQIDAHFAAGWRFTPGSLAMAPLNYTTDGVNWDDDNNLSVTVANYAIAKFGLLFHGGQNSGNDPLSTDPGKANVYAWGDLYPAQFYLQTVTGAALTTNVVRITFSKIDFTGGTYTLTYGANTTGALNWNDDPYTGTPANAPIVAAALNALPSIIAEGGVTVQTHTGQSAYTITWNNPVARASVISGTSSLTGPHSPYTLSETVISAAGTLDHILSSALVAPHTWEYAEIHPGVDGASQPNESNVGLASYAGTGQPASTVTYTGTFTDPAGVARKGTLTFTPVAPIDVTSGAILVQQDQTFTLDVNGKLNGNTGVTLTMGVAYYVTVRFAAAGGVGPNPLVLLVPGYGTTIDLATYSPL